MEKSDDIYWQIFHIFNMKCVMSGLITSNPISRKSLRPILANFMTVPILLLSATSTPNETSVAPPLGLIGLTPLVLLFLFERG